MNTIGNRLEYVRKQKGFTYSQLADLVGITGDAIRIAVKRDKVKDYYINVFSEKFEINRDWLLTGNGDIISSDPTEMEAIKSYLKQHEVVQPVTTKELFEPALSGYRELAEARLSIIDLLTTENTRLHTELSALQKLQH
jgi:transcriptional regulator with XRE-family HTH domain